MTAAILAAVILIILIYGLSRYVFGRRLHMSGGRARQPRLGVIDAYDLDRQRQLVLVRRDNVEHLIMIGGPNDLLIESAFVRAQPSVVVPPGRDKEAAVGGPVVSVALPSVAPDSSGEDRGAAGLPGPAPMAPQTPEVDLPPVVPAQPPRAPAPRTPAADLGRPVTPDDLGALSDLPAPGAAVTAEPPPPLQPAEPTTAPPRPETTPAPDPAAPVPLRPTRFPTAATRPAGSPLPPRPPLSGLRSTLPPAAAGSSGTPAAGTTAAGTGPARSAVPGLANRPAPSPMQRGTSAASLRRDPPSAPPPAEAPAPSAAPAPSEPVLATPGSAPGPAAPQLPTVTLDSIESLEEEMARLLGRAAGGEKS